MTNPEKVSDNVGRLLSAPREGAEVAETTVMNAMLH